MKRFLIVLMMTAALLAEEPKGLSPLNDDEIRDVLHRRFELERTIKQLQDSFTKANDDWKLYLERVKLAHGAAGCELDQALQWTNCAKSTPSGPAKATSKGAAKK